MRLCNERIVEGNDPNNLLLAKYNPVTTRVEGSSLMGGEHVIPYHSQKDVLVERDPQHPVC